MLIPPRSTSNTNDHGTQHLLPPNDYFASLPFDEFLRIVEPKMTFKGNLRELVKAFVQSQNWTTSDAFVGSRAIWFSEFTWGLISSLNAGTSPDRSRPEQGDASVPGGHMSFGADKPEFPCQNKNLGCAAMYGQGTVKVEGDYCISCWAQPVGRIPQASIDAKLSRDMSAKWQP
ncbi:hypothetical protein F5Y19DRAFT_477226 [Xylariaceae sp. FL1651]|nr:hypothetical protein F5Y19DRAFT_477226 [Xylariaceae sp. FL1651]